MKRKLFRGNHGMRVLIVTALTLALLVSAVPFTTGTAPSSDTAVGRYLDSAVHAASKAKKITVKINGKSTTVLKSYYLSDYFQVYTKNKTKKDYSYHDASLESFGK